MPLSKDTRFGPYQILAPLGAGGIGEVYRPCNLISRDGKSTRALGKIATPHLTFSKNGQTLYGIRTEKNHQYLFSLSLTGNKMKTIGDVGTEFTPRSYLNPGIRFSLSPDGKCILYPSFSTKTSLWMLEGFDTP